MNTILKFSSPNSKLRKTRAAVDAYLADHDGRINGVRVKGSAIWSFNLPAHRYTDPRGVVRVTCPGADTCVANCYANGQGHYSRPNVIKLRVDNAEALRAIYAAAGVDGVTEALSERIDALPRTAGILRFHDSGDLFARWYRDAVINLATRYPDRLFYLYTKSIPLIPAVLPPNVAIVQSFGSKFDRQIDMSRPHSIVFLTREDLLSRGYVDGSETDLPAIIGTTKIGLVYHGTRKAEIDQIKASHRIAFGEVTP